MCFLGGKAEQFCESQRFQDPPKEVELTSRHVTVSSTD